MTRSAVCCYVSGAPVSDSARPAKIERDSSETRWAPFRPHDAGPLAMLRTARMAEFSYSPGARNDRRTDDDVAIISVQGPLEHHAGWCWESFESVVGRVERAMSGQDVVEEALAAEQHRALTEMREPKEVDTRPRPARAVILRIDSPGGEAAGSMSTHRALRRLRKRFGVPLYAYADELAASAAYALASAADEIWLPDTGMVGSIGVIATLFDRTQQNHQMGLAIELVTSGKYKADNHADRPISDGVRARMQRRVDDLADVFFETVAKARGGDAKSVSDLEAALFSGQKAVEAGLADGVADFQKFLRTVRSSLDSQTAQAA